MKEERRDYQVILSAGTSDVEIKKSRFLGFLKNVRTEEAAREFLEEIRRQHRDARHHCFAYRLGFAENLTEKYSDDGEPQGTAGKPMLAILQGAGLVDTAAVVTRYFGGTLLGTGGLLRAYSDSLKEAMANSSFVSLKQGVRTVVAADYTLTGKIKYLASSMNVSTEKEEYADQCRFTYIAEETVSDLFRRKITDLSGGKASLSEPERVLFYLQKETPFVYKNGIS